MAHPRTLILMDVKQLEFFKYLPDKTKLVIFNILRELPVDVHLPILTILDLYEELRIIEEELAGQNDETYSTEFSDPEEEYERRLLKQVSRKIWSTNSSGNDTD